MLASKTPACIPIVPLTDYLIIELNTAFYAIVIYLVIQYFQIRHSVNSNVIYGYWRFAWRCRADYCGRVDSNRHLGFS